MKAIPGLLTIRKRSTVKMNNGRFQVNVSDEYVKSLPIKRFHGQILLVDHTSLFDDAKKILDKELLLGFDTETKPSFKKGRVHNVALLQLSTGESAVLFRLNKVHVPKFVIDILENKDIIKAGVALKDDLTGLKKIARIEPDSFIDLQKWIKQFGIEDNGLKKLAANVLGFRISKKCQTSNWEQDVLTAEQLEYAATDAWVCREIFTTLLNHQC